METPLFKGYIMATISANTLCGEEVGASSVLEACRTPIQIIQMQGPCWDTPDQDTKVNRMEISQRWADPAMGNGAVCHIL